MLSEAKKYHAYARECLEQAEKADTPEMRDKLIELSRVWLEAALREEGLRKTSPDPGGYL
jgi:hypothetical protein